MSPAPDTTAGVTVVEDDDGIHLLTRWEPGVLLGPRDAFRLARLLVGSAVRQVLR